MKRILITASGGAPAINFTRSLRDAPEDYYLVGVDCDIHNLHRSETDERFLVPHAKSESYISRLSEIIKKNEIDFVHAQPDVEVGVISECREELGAKVFLPSKETVKILRNKFTSYRMWADAGLKVPRNVFINNLSDLEYAYREFGEDIWLREVSGAAGRGSLASPDLQTAKAWIDSRNGWGKYVAAERLTSNTVTWMSLYKDGELIVAQGRKRLNWLFGDRTQSGVTGITGVGETVSDSVVDEISQKAVFAVDRNPNGIFSVDLTYDKDGVPNPTEINIGKFFTTHYFFTRAGLNMPHIYLKLAFDEELPEIKKKLNPLPSGLLWIRGMDIEPILVDGNKEV